ncbi:hypothetical protein [Paractinoplanes abujensis]|uniref:Uncharacterized protein n=1 Tax=Paractinoplanes abujensis TaxID=882441 RepID=A0A7W7CR75_9ACTN|nr:hypothetical protein [Actinoplanes abujensis]MBB4691461.1 hypothetical protein [Actinoplanes abujensis]
MAERGDQLGCPVAVWLSAAVRWLVRRGVAECTAQPGCPVAVAERTVAWARSAKTWPSERLGSTTAPRL